MPDGSFYPMIQKEAPMQYTPSPIDTSDIRLPDELLELCERLAEHSHDVWGKARIEQGWTFGPERNDQLKQTPCLVPYSELPESEKDFDRNAAMEVLKSIVKLGFCITKGSTD